MSRQSEVTQLLSELGRGGPAALDRLMPILYDELRHIARQYMRGERPDHTLDTTALVHEAYVKLVGLDRMTWQNRAHFLAVAAQAMRRVLVDYAVTRRAQKRGGVRQRVPLADASIGTDQPIETLVALDGALRRLERRWPAESRRGVSLLRRHERGGNGGGTPGVAGDDQTTLESRPRVAQSRARR